MAQYESEYTQFMVAWLKDHPGAQKERDEGIALWWDKPQNAETHALQAADDVPVKPYFGAGQ